MSNKATDMLLKREEKRATLIAELAALDAEIGVLRELVNDTATVKPQFYGGGKAKKVVNSRAERSEWKHILAFIVQRNIVKMSDIIDFSEGKGFDLSETHLRTKMAKYVDAKILDRVSAGVFQITEQGKRKASAADD